MRFGIKGFSAAVVATGVLTTTACSSSGTVAGPSADTSLTGTLSPTKRTTSASPPPTTRTTRTVPTTSATSSNSASGSGVPLTTDQIVKVLLTDKDDPGYTYDPARDDKTVAHTPEVLTAGGRACQTFVDAEEALSTKYGTTAEVDRALTNTAEAHGIHSSVAVLPTADKGLALISDLTAGLNGCKSLTMSRSDGPVTMVPTALQTLMRDGEAGFVDYVTIHGNTVLMVFELVHVGTAVSEVVLVGPVTDDKTSLEQMGTTLARLSDVQVERLKAAQGINW